MSCSKSGCKCGEVAIAATQPRPSCSLGAVSCSQIYTANISVMSAGTARELFADFCTTWLL